MAAAGGRRAQENEAARLPCPEVSPMLLRALVLPLSLLVSAPVLAQEAAGGRAVDVPDFHGVAVGHGIRAEVRPGARSVRLEGSQEELSRVKVVVKEGVLRTEVEPGGPFFSPGLKDVRLYVTSPRVESIAASGGSQVDAEATRVEGFQLAASGGSRVTLRSVDSRELKMAASGGSVLKLEGRAEALEVAANGGSIIEAREVRAESLEVAASGGSQVKARPSRSIQGALSGGSMVTASREPERVQVQTSGGSRVRYE
jgi:hypothetical protein